MGLEVSRFRRSREMRPEEVERFLTGHWWGVLATSVDDEPYAVPVVYGRAGDDFYVVAREGRKVRNIRRNAAVCLTVTRVEEEGRGWSSVVISGEARLVRGPRHWAAALRALRGQCGMNRPVTPEDALRLARARVVRIQPDRVTGRTVAPRRGSSTGV